MEKVAKTSQSGTTSSISFSISPELASVPLVMPLPAVVSPPITVNNPIFSQISTQVANSSNPNFLNDVVNLINRSPTLLAAIAANPAGTVVKFTASITEGGDTSPNSKVINISALSSFDDSEDYTTGPGASGSQVGITAAGVFVGALSHEEFHQTDPNLAAVYNNLGLYTTEQGVSTELLSEGGAASLNAQALKEIAASTAVNYGLLNKNILFTAGTSNDQAVLSKMTSLLSAGGNVYKNSAGYGSEVSYAASVFANSTVNGNTYLFNQTTYFAQVTKNYTGLTAAEAATIHNFTPIANATGGLVSCSYSTPTQTFTNACGAPGSQQTTITNTSGAKVGTIDIAPNPSPAPATETLNGIGLTLPVAANTDVTATGTGYNLNLGENDNYLATSGSTGTIDTMTGDELRLSSYDFYYLNGSNTTTDIAGAGDTVDLTGTGNLVNDTGSTSTVIGAGTTVGLGGSNPLSFTAASGNESIVDYVQNATISASGGTLTSMLETAAPQVLSASGSYEVITTSGGETLNLGAGNNNSITLSTNNLVNVGANAGATYTGTGATFSIDGNGSSSTFNNVGNGVNDYAAVATVIGASLVQLTTNNQTLMAGSVAEPITDFGTNNYITAMNSPITSVAQSGTTQTVTVGGIGNGISTTAGETITLAANASAQVSGVPATVSLGNGDAVGFSSSGNVVDDLGTSAAVIGGGQTIGLDLSGGQTLSTGAATQSIIDFGTNNYLTSDYSSINLFNPAEALSLAGSGNTVAAPSSDTIRLTTGGGNLFNVATGDTVALSAATSATLTGGSTAVTAGVGSSAVLNGLSYNYTGNGANTTVSAGMNSGGTINGGPGLTANLGVNSHWTVNNGNTLVNASAGSQATLQMGAVYTYNDGTGAAGTGVNTGSYSSGTINASGGLTVNTGGNSTWTFNDGSATVNGGAASAVTLQNGQGYNYSDPTGASGTGVVTGASSAGQINSSPGLTANVGVGSSWNFTGGSALVNASATSQTTFLNGGGYVFNEASGAAGTGLTAAAGTNGTVNGSPGLTTNLGVNTSYAFNGGSVTVNGSAGSFANLLTGDAYVVAGANMTIGIQVGVQATVEGTNLTLSAGGAGYHATIGNGSKVTTGGAGGALTLGKNDTVTITNSGETINGRAPTTTGSAGVATSDGAGNVHVTFNGNPNEQLFISATGSYSDQVVDPNGTTPITSGDQSVVVNKEIANYSSTGASVELTNEETTYVSGKATGTYDTERFLDPANSYGWNDIDRVFTTGGAFVTQTIYNRNNSAVGEAPVAAGEVSVGAYNSAGTETASGVYNVTNGQFGSTVSGSSLAAVLASGGASQAADLPALTFALTAANNTAAGFTPGGVAEAVQGAYSPEYGPVTPPGIGLTALNNASDVGTSDVSDPNGYLDGYLVPDAGGDALEANVYYPDATPVLLGTSSVIAPLGGTVAAVAINLAGSAVSTTAEASLTATFDATDDGSRVPVGWITSGEGLLITDPNGSLTSLSSANLVQSFAALSGLDVNHTGVLNASDPGWTTLSVWEPASTGTFAEADVKTLAQLGITAIDLNPKVATMLNNGNLIYGTDTATLSGHSAAIAQLGLSYDPAVLHPLKIA